MSLLPPLPQPRRPFWHPSQNDSFPLLYLSWGKRRYDLNPIPRSEHPGWVYFFLKKGSLFLDLPAVRRLIAPGTLMIFHPKTIHGFSSPRGKAIEMRTWMWRDSAPFPSISPLPGVLSKIRFSAEGASMLEEIHQKCREEIQNPDDYTPFQIQSLSMQLNLLAARTLEPRKEVSRKALRSALAVRWLEENPGSLYPVQELAEYFDLNPLSIRRLFSSRFGETPSHYARKLRMERAKKLLQTHSLKESAAILGYEHANDLSRVFLKYWGKNASVFKRGNS